MKPLTLILVAAITSLLFSCSKEIKTQGSPAPAPVTFTASARTPLCEVLSGSGLPTRSSLRTQSVPFLVYLNFTGTTVSGTPWNDGRAATITCLPSRLSPLDQQLIADNIRGLYAPFNIIITTDASTYNNYPSVAREMGIITESYSWYGHAVAGVSYTGSSLFATNTPFFVFSYLMGNNPLYVQDGLEHEMGHTFGLMHQATIADDGTYVNDYNAGYGYGPLSFVPVMGQGYDKHIHNWFVGKNPNGVIQDDYRLLSAALGNTSDDYADAPSEACKPLTANFSGILNKGGDVDYIKLLLKEGEVITATSDRIDLKLSLYDNKGNLVDTANDASDTHATLAAKGGIHFLKVEAASNAFASARFMTGDYHVAITGVTLKSGHNNSIVTTQQPVIRTVN